MGSIGTADSGVICRAVIEDVADASSELGADVEGGAGVEVSGRGSGLGFFA